MSHTRDDGPNCPRIHATLGRRRFLKAVGAAGALTPVITRRWAIAQDAPAAEPPETPIGPPQVFIQEHHEHSVVTYSNPARLEDGALIRYGVDRSRNRLLSQTSKNGGRTWSENKDECEALPGTYGVLPLLSRDGEIHLAAMVGRGDGREIAVDRFIDIWHQRTTGKRTTWEKPNVIFRGYCGALLDFKQLSSGRLVCPFAWWVPKRPCAPPIGANLCTVFYSDDRGRTWTKSKSDLSSPCYPNFVGNNYGANEPCILELNDGRLWMLMRTQTGVLYESFSRDQGETWSEAQPRPLAHPHVRLELANARLHRIGRRCDDIDSRTTERDRQRCQLPAPAFESDRG